MTNMTQTTSLAALHILVICPMGKDRKVPCYINVDLEEMVGRPVPCKASGVQNALFFEQPQWTCNLLVSDLASQTSAFRISLVSRRMSNAKQNELLIGSRILPKAVYSSSVGLDLPLASRCR